MGIFYIARKNFNLGKFLLSKLLNNEVESECKGNQTYVQAYALWLPCHNSYVNGQTAILHFTMEGK